MWDHLVRQTSPNVAIEGVSSSWSYGIVAYTLWVDVISSYGGRVHACTHSGVLVPYLWCTGLTTNVVQVVGRNYAALYRHKNSLTPPTT